MADTPKKTGAWETTFLTESKIVHGKLGGQGPQVTDRQSVPEKKVSPTASTGGPAGVRAGFASWPEIPGHEKCSVHSLHAQLLFTQWMASGDFQNLQLMQTESLLRHAGKQAPYYLDSLGFLDRLPPGGLTEEYFVNLPILTPRAIQESGEEIMARNRPENHGRSRLISVSMPKGEPVRVTTTGLADLWARSLNLRNQDWHGLDASLVNLDICDTLHRKKTLTGRWSELPWSGPSTALSIDRPIEHLYKDFIRIRPDYLHVRPSILQAFVELSIARGAKPENLSKVICRGGYLDPEVRGMAEDTWGVPVVTIYSAPEIGIMALQCPGNDHLHVQSEYVRLEVLDDDNMPSEPGETGRVVVTPLHNYQTPLVRYAIGDYAEVGEPCSCGRNLPVLNRILESKGD